MKKKLCLFLTVALTAVLLVSAGMAAHSQLQYQENAASYEDAAQCARFSPPPAAPRRAQPIDAGQDAEALWTVDEGVLQALAGIDLEALQAVNPDVVGWIYIPDTELSYPLLYGADNDYYLDHTWDGVRNSGGAIFFDYRCAPEFENFNTIIYGHRMLNSAMFNTLKNYKDPDFWREHPVVYIMDRSGVHVYEIFAAWEPSVTSIAYTLDLSTEEKRQEFLDTALEESQVDTGVTPGPMDKFLMLSTCAERGHATRWVVQAVERETGG